MRKIIIFLSLILILTGCSKDYIAIVNNQEISKSDFERNFKQLKEYYPDTNENDLKKYLLEDMVIDTILLQKAKEENISISESVIQKNYQELISSYDNEKAMLNDLKKFGFSKEQLLKDIEEQLIIQEYLKPVKNIDQHIKDLVKKSEIKIKG